MRKLSEDRYFFGAVLLLLGGSALCSALLLPVLEGMVGDHLESVDQRPRILVVRCQRRTTRRRGMTRQHAMTTSNEEEESSGRASAGKRRRRRRRGKGPSSYTRVRRRTSGAGVRKGSSAGRSPCRSRRYCGGLADRPAGEEGGLAPSSLAALRAAADAGVGAGLAGLHLPRGWKTKWRNQTWRVRSLLGGERTFKRVRRSRGSVDGWQ